MAIKLYKSQLEPTEKTSNVYDRRQISLSEAQSVGKAMKGFLNAGENLFIKHQQIKSENDLFEKKKSVMNGSENKQGLSAHKLIASQMNDPDQGLEYYKNEVQKVKDTTNNFNGLFAKKYFKAGADELIINDVNASLFGRSTALNLLKSCCKDIFIPVTLAGGLKNINDVTRALESGADKVAINSAAVKNKSIIKDVAQMFGSQALIISINAKKISLRLADIYSPSQVSEAHKRFEDGGVRGRLVIKFT